MGYNSSNSSTGTVNGETVEFLDHRTVPGNVHFNQTVVDSFTEVITLHGHIKKQ